MLLIGHRGCNYPGYNQNTLRAFAKVTEEGVSAIEFDVQLSADGRLVVIHNLDLKEVSTGQGRVNRTDSIALRTLYAGDPAQGYDRIPFLSEVFDFFAARGHGKRPAIHMELKGDHTGDPAGRLLRNYLETDKLKYDDLLVSSFNWDELAAIRRICPFLKIGLLDGAIRRQKLLAKTGPEIDKLFERLFAYGCEDYMLPRYPTLKENLSLLEEADLAPQTCELVAQEISDCLEGRYYNENLLDTASEMEATSVNLWYRTVDTGFIEKAHDRGLKVLVYTVNDPRYWRKLAEMGIDGLFTDNFAGALEFFKSSATVQLTTRG